MKVIKGICPAVFAIYTDETCNRLDIDAYRIHIRRLIESGVDALVTGGHAGEMVCLSAEERAELTSVAKEESAGRIPIVGGVVADSTAEAIRQGHEAVASGADAVLFTPPSIPGWTSVGGESHLLRHYSAFEDSVGIPIIMFAAPTPLFGTQYHLTPETIKQLVRSIESIVGAKITSSTDVGGFVRCARAMKEVRDIGCLMAGGAAQFPHYSTTLADGILSGGTNFAHSDDVQVLRLMEREEFSRAKKITDRWDSIWDVIYGVQAGLPVAYFHYRYKVAAWLLGVIDIPNMRLPQVPPPVEDIKTLRQALVASGHTVVREAEELAVASI